MFDGVDLPPNIRQLLSSGDRVNLVNDLWRVTYEMTGGVAGQVTDKENDVIKLALGVTQIRSAARYACRGRIV